MPEIQFPFGKNKLPHFFREGEVQQILTSSIEDFRPHTDPQALIEEALDSPVGSPSLTELAKGKEKIVIIASDHTRPVPSKLIIPSMLCRIRQGNPDARITLLIATGCHRGTTKEELVAKFGEEIVRDEQIVIHDCDDREMLADLGILPSGGRCEINRLAYEADLLVAEGFIEPHFFAGFSGGRKSVLPGIAGRSTVLANHCSDFIAHPCARTGVLKDNPIHKDMLWAAEKARLAFIVNVVLNGEKEVIFATAGDAQAAHEKGTSFLSSLCGASAAATDIVITTNGGYPLDQNMYQAVKGMTAAEAAVKKNGVIIMLAASDDGIGGDHFYHQLADEEDLSKTRDLFLSRSRQETVPDQWQSQILVRILLHARVVYVSHMSDTTVEAMHMIPAHSLEEALVKAKELLGLTHPTVTVIPDGVSVMVTPK